MELAYLPATELREAFARRTLSPVELLDALAARIEALGPHLGAFTALRLDAARAEAAAAERAYAQDEAGPLAGLPVAVKDLVDTADLPTAYGSRIFRGHRPAADAPVVARIRAAGGIVLGKTQLHEFAWGLTSVNANGSSRNPWDTARVPGGSSGGSAVALAAGLAPLALGTDTGGSIRVPAAFCGVVGLKPTWGRVCAEGVWPLAPSLDHVGPMTRTPADARLLLEALTGEPAPLPPRVAGLRAAVLPELGPVEPGVRPVLDAAAETLVALGLDIVAADLPELGSATAVYRPIQFAEALAVHAGAGLYPERAGEYGEDVRARLELARATTLAEHVEAALGRERLRAGFGRLFRSVDVAVSAVAACAPPRADADLAFVRDAVLPYTAPADLTGLPACAVRAGFDPDGLPVGIQVIGPAGREDLVLAVAEAFVAATGEVQDRRPCAVGDDRATA